MRRVREYLTIGALPPGSNNAITDVPGVSVGHATVRTERLRTGVTAVLPREPAQLLADNVTAGCAVLNGYGKSLGLMQIDELGTIETPILLTSTLNVPRAADALLELLMEEDETIGRDRTVNPVVLECFDGYLSDARARAVGDAEVADAVRTAAGAPVAVGCVGAGTGMCYMGFKSGVGTASRVIPTIGHSVGVLVVPNFPGDLVIAGAPVGRELAAGHQPPARGSCVFVVATDAPLASVDLRRLAWRCFFGMARTGAVGWHQSGELAVAFTTAARQERQTATTLNRMFRAVGEAAEEAILDALIAAETTEGRDGHRAVALPIADVLKILRRYGAPVTQPVPSAP